MFGDWKIWVKRFLMVSFGILHTFYCFHIFFQSSVSSEISTNECCFRLEYFVNHLWHFVNLKDYCECWLVDYVKCHNFRAPPSHPLAFNSVCIISCKLFYLFCYDFLEVLLKGLAIRHRSECGKLYRCIWSGKYFELPLKSQRIKHKIK